MARIAGLELQDKWRVDYALTHIRGVGWALSKKILQSASISPDSRVSELSPEKISKLSAVIDEYPTGAELTRQVKSNLARLKQIGTYRGMRHLSNVPVRGQRTRTNARTKRGKRKTVGAYKKEMLAKMSHQKTQKKDKE
jgi:small subunit ribosomal protein S13